MGERIPGGLASGRKPEEFDPEQLAAGVEVEREHTTDREVAREIAMDHLTEDPDYYRKLRRMEKALRDVGAWLALVEQVPEADLTKAERAARANHKYIMRQPTGKPRPKWRYWYKMPGGKGVVTHDRLVEGARFAGAHGGQVGHWEVLSSGDDGVFARHSSGAHVKMDHDAFASAVNAQHAGAQGEARAARRREIMESLKVLREGGGGRGQGKRVSRLIDEAVRLGWISEKEAQLYRNRLQPAEDKAAADDPAAKLRAALAHATPEHRDAILAHMRSLEEERQKLETEGGGKPAVPAVRGERDSGLGLRGKLDNMKTADATGKGQDQPFRYRLVPLEDMVPSHNPEDQFREHPQYPKGVQERHYDQNKESQLTIRQRAGELEPRFLVNTNPDAANGPPIIIPNGVVLGGNSRTMTLQLAYHDHPEQAQKYRDYIREHAATFGFSAEDVGKIKDPVLVREVDDPGTQKERALLGRRYNESFTRALAPQEEQVTLGKQISEGTLERLTDYTDMLKESTDEPTFDAFLRSNRSRPFVESLVKDGVIDERNRDRYLLPAKSVHAGLLNEVGRVFASSVLMGKIIDNVDDLDDLGKTYRDRISSQLPVILAAAASNKQFDLSRALRTAVGVLAQQEREGKAHPWLVLKQGDTSRRNAETGQEEATGAGDYAHPVYKDPLAQAMVAVFSRASQKGTGPAFRKFADLAAQPSSAGGMFDDGPTDEERALAGMRAAFGFSTDDPLREVEAAENARRAESKRAAAGRNQEAARQKMAERGVKTIGETAGVTRERRPRPPRSTAAAPATPAPSAGEAALPVKRGPGRPRIHPLKPGEVPRKRKPKILVEGRGAGQDREQVA